jgi:flagellar biosynthesis/type III secretory pathway M-ring protein FliF/YscJ
MGGVAESNRQRIAFVLMGVGLILTLLGLGLLWLQQPAAQPLVPSTQAALAPPPAVKAQAMRQALFWLVVLVLVFLVSSMAFLRWSRHFRRSILRKPHSPTPSEDVWAMHKLPEGAVDEWSDSGSGEAPDEKDPPPAL